MPIDTDLIDIDNHTDFDVDIDFLLKILTGLIKNPIELIIVYNDEIQELNKIHRSKDKPTDVLSFPYEYEGLEGLPIGSIVISIDLVKEKAKEYGHTQNEEFALLFIHGLLHLLGFDHEIDGGEHRQKEIELIKKYDLPESLIVRND
jgi:probable rRNA maturation factor